MARSYEVEFEGGDFAITLTFLIEEEGDDGFSIDDSYILTSEDGGKAIPRTWQQLLSTYDNAALIQARHEALECAVDDDWSDEHDLDDEGD